jgi:hypothetical protein
VSLIGRHLETNGIPTVIMGCARDIVESAGVARFYWSDFPLGNSAGKPNDIASQTDTLRGALRLFDEATEPRTTAVSPQRWADDETWKLDFMNVDRLSADDIARLKADFQAQKDTASRIKAGQEA